MACRLTPIPQESPPSQSLPASPSTAVPTITPLPPQPTPISNPSPIPDTGWVQLGKGLERRVLDIEGEGAPASLYLLRLEPARFHFGIAYHPGQPQTLPEWEEETGALLLVNGGFFTESFTATGLIIVDGAASGVTYGDFAGMLAIMAAGPEIRWLRQQPYNPNEPLRYALQSFPLLVQPGGRVGYERADDTPSRRTVIAQDNTGRILFALVPWGGVTLPQLAAWLAASDLAIDIALNLDGGSSTGLLLTQPSEIIPPLTPLPAVITVQRK